MRASTPEVLRRDGQVLVEARTASDALSAVTDELGASARIVAVDRVIRGGIAGFFARERVQVTAEPPPSDAGPDDVVMSDLAPAHAGDVVADEHVVGISGATGTRPGRTVSSAFATLLRQSGSATPSVPAPSGPPPPGTLPDAGEEEAGTSRVPPVVRRTSPALTGSPVAIALDRLITGATRHANFADALRAELIRAGWRPELGNPGRRSLRRVWVGGPVGQSPQAETSVAGECERPRWSGETLRRLGFPSVVATAADGASDETARTAAIATVLQDVCGPLPAAPCAFVGPAAGAIATAALPLVTSDQAWSAEGDICLAVDDDPVARSEIEWLRNGRWLHLIVGGGSWRRLLLDGPQAVSWLEDADLPAAVTVALDFGLTLAAPTAHGGDRVAADPEAIAAAIVSLAERAAGEGQR